MRDSRCYSEKMERKHYGNLDLLRLALATQVVALHVFRLYGGWKFNELVPSVCAFVCLSGFLIPGSFDASNGYGHFAWKRLLRVGPAFLASLVLVAVLAGPASIPPTLLGYASIGLITTATANGVLWTLALEEVLYAGHALSRLIKALWNPTAIMVLFGACVVARVVSVVPEWIRIWEIAASFLLGNLGFFYRERLARVHWSFYGLAAVLLAGALLANAIPSFWFFAVGRPALCLGVVLFAFTAPQIKAKMQDWSYGTYIYHWPIMVAVAQFRLPVYTTFGLVLAVTYALSAASWRWLEKPALKQKSRLPTRRRRGVAVATI